MALKIICPQCTAEFFVVEAFSGSKLSCPQCNSAIILAFKTQYSHTNIPGPKAILSTQVADLQEEAINHLEIWLDVPAIAIKNALEMLEQNQAYEVWKIPKGESNTYREIAAPSEILKHIQRRILDRLLYRIPVSNASHGFIQGRSIVTNANFHLKTACAILNFDLKEAFPSIDAQRVKHLLVRYLKIPLKHLGENIPHEALNHVIDILVKLTTYKGVLPQGGPASGYLLNIACITLDKNIYKALSKYGTSYRYTRYADDITISAPMPFPDGLRSEIETIIHNSGLQVNPKKVRYAVRTQGQKLEVTGLILEKDKVRIPSQKLEIFRAIIHQASTIETVALLPEKRLEIQSIIAFVKMVYGKIPYRIWAPYKTYMEKHGIFMPRKASKAYLSLYPH